ncbi:MAG: phage gp6-like head-tail connector protein [Clostridia bacterium]|nr:phage gp6-like head-tail connector protein [Clostridia bacterium]
MTLQEVKNFLRVDFSADDRMIFDLIGAAELYLKGAVGESCDVTDPRAKYLMLLAIRDMYDGGEMSKRVSGNTAQLFTDFSLQLRLEGKQCILTDESS